MSVALDAFWPATPVLLAFVATSLAMNVTPGLDMVFVLGQTFQGGPRAGRLAAAGIAAGSLCHAIVAAAGLTALVAAAPRVLTAITYIGAAYLLYVGVRMLRPGAGPALTPAAAPEASHSGAQAFRRGVLVNLFNVKVILFYLTFVPQFVRLGAGPTWQQVLFFGIAFNVLGTAVLLAVATASGWAASLSASPRAAVVLSRVAGVLLVVLAISLLWSR
jgi:threonine/homoserine/homoserine lactone efflux protein